MKKRVGVLALQGDVREHSRAIQQSGAVSVSVKRQEDLASIDALIIPGGESTTIGKLLRIFELLDPLKKSISEGLPVFGTCAGMILLAKDVIDGSHGQETIGTMDITVRRNAFGRQVDSFEKSLDLSNIGAGSLTAVFIRAPWIEKQGSNVQALASVESGNESHRESHVVLARQDRQLAASFHPEILEGQRYEVHEYFIREVAS